ncbi:TIGR04066 family peptide maturation system protein [Clostridiaceae bacterium M8S5]|nr:TIGR04066 family peptide maturation system protein [Clostridiaceae bacterium M8S5]
MKEKLIIYPYNYEFASIIRNNLLSEYEIVHLIAPRGFALTGKDAGIADHGSAINIDVKTNLKDHIEECDTVLIADCVVLENFKKTIYKNIEDILASKKNVLCTMTLEENQLRKYKKLADENNVYFKYYGEYPNYDVVIDMQWKNSIYETEVPVVFVLGETEYTNKYEIQLMLKQQLNNMGYKVSLIGSRHYSELFGVRALPNFMIRDEVNESDKIILFNRFLKIVEKQDEPDIIIVGIPGGIMTHSKKFTNRFGLLAYELAQAITPDFVVLSLLYNEVDNKFYEEINTLMKYRFGFEIDCFNISNIQLNQQASLDQNKLIYDYIDYDFVVDKKQEIDANKHIYQIFDKNDRLTLVNQIIETLSGYSDNQITNLGGMQI